MSPPKRGIFVVVEGLDKAGKSSQCAQLAQNAESLGYKVLAIRFPDRTTTIGKMIDAYLKGDQEAEDHVIHLLFSANRWEAASRIEAAVAAGKVVIADRYFYSGVVYSAAKANPTLPASWARAPDVGLPLPDVCFFLDIAAEVAAQRGEGYGEEKYETREMQRRVREEFGRLLPGERNVLRVDAGREMKVVEREMLDVFKEAVKRLEEGPGDLDRVGEIL